MAVYRLSCLPASAPTPPAACSFDSRSQTLSPHVAAVHSSPDSSLFSLALFGCLSLPAWSAAMFNSVTALACLQKDTDCHPVCPLPLRSHQLRSVSVAPQGTLTMTQAHLCSHKFRSPSQPRSLLCANESRSLAHPFKKQRSET